MKILLYTKAYLIRIYQHWPNHVLNFEKINLIQISGPLRTKQALIKTERFFEAHFAKFKFFRNVLNFSMTHLMFFREMWDN